MKSGDPVPGANAHDGDVQMAALGHRLQRREDFFVSQVARSAEEDKCVGVRASHSCRPFKQPFCRQSSPGGRRTENASPIAACPHNPPHRAN